MNIKEFIIFLIFFQGRGYENDYYNTYPPKIILQAAKEYLVTSNFHLTLPCLAIGTPSPMYSWTKNGRFIATQTSGTLLITSDGIYQCEAKNYLGSAFSDISSVKTAYQNTFKIPHITIEINVTLGSFLILPCNAPNGYPETHVTWSIKTNYSIKIVKENTRITTDFVGNLYFSNVNFDDFQEGSTYFCIVDNPVAQVVTNGNEYFIRVSEKNESLSSFLLWKSPDQDTSLIGKPKTLKCIFSGNPAPNITWTKLNSKLSRHVIYTAHELIISNITFNDQGVYRCAINDHMWHDIYLNVGASPSLRKEMTDINIIEGDSAIITCNALGVPRPDVQWFFNGIPVRKHLKAVTETDNYFLKIENATKTDSKVVQCNASNKHGYIFGNAYINVLAQPPSAVDSQVQITVLIGSNVSINCPVAGLPKPEIDWYSANGSILAKNISKYTIYNISSSNHIKCQASNKYGEKDVLLNVDVKSKLRAKIYSSNDIPYKNETIMLTCYMHSHDSAQTLKIKWFKDGVFLNSKNTSTKKDDSTHFLIIDDLQMEDSGIYSCNVSADYDWNVASLRIQVRGPPLAPQYFEVSNCSSSSVVISWIDGFKYYDPIIEYIIYKRSSYDLPNINTCYSVPNEILRTHIPLNPWTNYSFSIRSRNTFGLSPLKTVIPQGCYTYPKKPTINPIDICGEDRKPNVLVITWKIVPPRYHFGEGFYYKIIVKNLSDPRGFNMLTTSDWYGREVVIRSAGIFLPYEVSVQSNNVIGSTDINKHEIKLIYSGQDVPNEAPKNVKLLELHEYSAIFMWTSINESKANGFLIGYKLSIWRNDDLICEKNIVTNKFHPCLMFDEQIRNKTIKQITFRYDKLNPGIVYDVGIEAMNSAGYVGPSSLHLKFRTREGRPGKIENLNILQVSSDNIVITWNLPNVTNGNLIGYDLEYKYANLSESNVTHLRTTKRPFKVCNLMKNMTYFITIYALTSAGRSDGNSIVITTLPDPLLTAPIIKDIQIINKGMNVSWTYDSNTSELNKGCYYYIEYRQGNKYLQSLPTLQKSWIILNNLSHGSLEIRVLVKNSETEVRSNTLILYFEDESIMKSRIIVVLIIITILAKVILLTVILKKKLRTEFYFGMLI